MHIFPTDKKHSGRHQRQASTDNKVRIGRHGTSASISEQHSGTLGTIHPFSATIRRFPEIIIRKWGKIPHHLICLLFSLVLFIIPILSTFRRAFSFVEMAAFERLQAAQGGPPSAFFEHDPRQLNTKTRATTKPSSLSPSHTSEMLFVGLFLFLLASCGSKCTTKPRGGNETVALLRNPASEAVHSNELMFCVFWLVEFERSVLIGLMTPRHLPQPRFVYFVSFLRVMCASPSSWC